MLGFLMMLESDLDREILGRVYVENLVHLQKVAARFLPRESTLGEDAIGDVFEAVAKRFSDLRDLSPAAWTAYLTVAVKNRCKTLLLREGRYAAWEELPPAPALSTEGLSGQAAQAVNLIAGLPPIYRDILECRLLLALDNRETAALLGLTEETAKKRFQRARALAADTLRKEGIALA